MAEAFRVQSTSGFDRREGLSKAAQGISDLLDHALAILEIDPLNNMRKHSIGKLSDVRPGDGQYRLRLGRWRFRYDVSGSNVTLRYCGLRREDAYR